MQEWMTAVRARHTNPRSDGSPVDVPEETSPLIQNELTRQYH